MKILFMTFHTMAQHSGISRKILNQVEALRECGVETALCFMQIDAAGHRYRLVDGTAIEHFGAGALGKARSLTAYAATLRHILDSGYNAVYVRHERNANPWLARMFQKLRAHGVKIFVEIPTFPYDGEKEEASRVARLVQTVDRMYRQRMFKHVDRVVSFVNVPQIFGVPALPISNAINFSDIPVKPRVNDTRSVFTFVAVAEMQAWHGLDRMIRGLAAYKGDRAARFHIVGEAPGSEKKLLLRLAQKLSLADTVLFHGGLAGEELHRIVHAADMGIASLGRHRCGISHIKTLKNREYAAYGLPFAYAETDEDFEHMPYIFKVPADESAVDVQGLMAFHDGLPLSPQQIRSSIEDSLSWRVQMHKVVQALGENGP